MIMFQKDAVCNLEICKVPTGKNKYVYTEWLLIMPPLYTKVPKIQKIETGISNHQIDTH